MLFNTLTFAYFFVAVFAVAWLLAPFRKVRLFFLLCASYVFYAGWTFVGWDELHAAWRAEPWGGAFWAGVWTSIKYIPLLFVATSIDYWLGRALDAVEDPGRRKLFAICTIIINVGILVFFKYWNWGVDTFQWLAALGGIEIPDVHFRVELPIGISFFCFMSLSYVIDVYRRTIPSCKSYLEYLTYISFFPHLVAGPIIRGRDLLPYLARDTSLTAQNGGEGLFLVAAGLFKKVVIGDYLAVNFVDRVYNEPTSYSALETLIAMYGYAVQVYCDFSGYSDVAIGAALLLGYRFKINFDSPYKALNIVEFWRRWHISLSTWLRDYVYIPLGGSRAGKLRKYGNVFLTMVVCGIWHGAAWTYVVFGALHGVALVATHYFHELRGTSARDSEERASPILRVISVAATFTFVSLSFVLFRAASLDKAMEVYARLFSRTFYAPNLGWKQIGPFHLPVIVLVILGALCLQWTPRRIYDWSRDVFIRAPAPVQALVLFLVAFFLREAASAEAVPFVYFQF